MKTYSIKLYVSQFHKNLLEDLMDYTHCAHWALVMLHMSVCRKVSGLS